MDFHLPRYLFVTLKKSSISVRQDFPLTKIISERFCSLPGHEVKIEKKFPQIFALKMYKSKEENNEHP